MAKKILIIDDDQPIRMVVTRILKSAGHSVLTADSTAAAEHLLRYNRVDLVICDYQMPGGDGLTFLSQLKHSQPQVLRVLLTGNADLHVSVGAVNRARVHYFVTKPFEPDDLRRVVHELFDWSERDGASGRPFTRSHERDLDELTAAHPGIADVARDEHGAVVIDDLELLAAEPDRYARKLDGLLGVGPPARKQAEEDAVLFDDAFLKLLEA